MQSSEGLSVYRNIYTCKILHIDQISENKLFTFHSDAQEQRERRQFGVIFRQSQTNPKRIFEVDIVLCIGLVLAWGAGFQVWSGMTEKSKLGMAERLQLGMAERGFPQGRQGMGRGRRSRP